MSKTKKAKSDLRKAVPTHIDWDEIEKQSDLIAERRGLGGSRAGYRLALPYGGRRIETTEQNTSFVLTSSHENDQ